ncbi:Panacea domain-containing protein [Nesterenkonia jeotgali]|uniref:Antitoxin SocA-like Panacea domain-containing protein n=1 Tax=Nesterenkonia jeotgali TaxID=317018 RepID=A0A0W8IGI4_9MICC|nr:type II toxin-antitoxin system antitoxin SocA domain-containing protein [Nesterenkonia jeotgali]KUG58939.1 hypothetical protein AVL63_02645 [Nesterenkonia jeotgali]
MATSQAQNLAAYIVEQFDNIETLKLQKLLYYCNAWSLALRDRAIFQDPIQAWRHGPVVKSIYGYHRQAPTVSEWPFGSASELKPEERELADAVIDLYGARSGWALRNLTHEEAPWRDAWDRCAEGEILNEPIEHDAMKVYYRSLIS